MVELLILLALVTGGLIVAGLTLGPRSRDQARRAHRLLAILHDDATARVRDEQEHLVTLGALRETRNRVAAGTFEPATFDPFRQPLSRQQPVGPVVAVLLAIAVGAVALLLMAHSSQSPPPSQAAAQAEVPVAPRTDAPAVTDSPPTTAPDLASAAQPAAGNLTMVDFTAACRDQYGDATATAEIVRNSGEPPSYWVKCFVGGQIVGGLDLDGYCVAIGAGARSDNPRRFDYTVADQPWLSWECVST